MANGTGDGDGKGNANSSKLATAVSSSSSTVSTTSSAATAAAVSEASSSTTSLPSLSSATGGSVTASLVHVTTLLPPSAPSAAAAVAAAGDSPHGLVVARPACVAFHDLSTLEATSTSDAADGAAAAGSVKCVTHLPGGGGTAAVTGHQDGRLRLWRASSRSRARLRLAAALPTVSDRLRRFPVPSNHVAVRRHHRRLWIEHADAVAGVAASADGRLLFSVSWDRTLKVWAVPSLRCLQSLAAHDDAVNAVAVAPDGTVYTGSADKRVRVWAPDNKPPPSRRAARGKRHQQQPVVYHLVATLSRHTAAVNALAVGCGGQALYSGGNDRSVLVWEREDSASHMVAIGALRGHRKAVLSVACAPGGLVVSGSADQTVRAWRRAADGRGYACVAVIDGHHTAVRSVAAAPVPIQLKRSRAAGGVDGGDEEWRVCSASFDGEVRVWSLRVSGLFGAIF
jgi:WD40 repeat protein